MIVNVESVEEDGVIMTIMVVNVENAEEDGVIMAIMVADVGNAIEDETANLCVGAEKSLGEIIKN